LILADTSAWIEFLRATGSDAHLRVRGLLEAGELATTDAVTMEVLVGARDAGHHDRLKRLLLRCEFVAVQGPRDYENAAEVARACRQAGDGVRGLIDCLIACVAIREGLPVLHADADFDVISRHTRLEVVSAKATPR
jgi:predicted nucleic acid-binding protein